jgi:hypothetical protein
MLRNFTVKHDDGIEMPFMDAHKQECPNAVVDVVNLDLSGSSSISLISKKISGEWEEEVNTFDTPEIKITSITFQAVYWTEDSLREVGALPRPLLGLSGEDTFTIEFSDKEVELWNSYVGTTNQIAEQVCNSYLLDLFKTFR